MFDIFDQWIVLSTIGWAAWFMFKRLSRKAYSCDNPCEKKIFKQSSLVSLRIKSR